MENSKALEIAQQICRTLEPYCDVIKIAGSIRRGEPEVKDIEICCLAKTIEVPEKKEGLFEDIITPAHTLTHPVFIKLVNELGIIEKGKPTGKYMKIHLGAGIDLDLFMPSPHDFYRQYAIRTGSAEFSQKVLAIAWRKLGWVGTSQGLRKDFECTNKATTTGSIWICKVDNPQLPPVWESEKDFFKWLQIEYVEPIKRNR